ncbi:Glycoside hydrolase/deacetylase, beta/alpha-barrel [Acididesulfobacillus acetoxydans]|uniref:Glycoside hydrolase/deacetylase, beta/alpha-barrel n=1 Tax=Acididesulfobacillus acetoxydans TaxID=1561005 RepID=A0A8S0X0E3_9FIRM|nr:polysaccharide deacetylase family protein [Acididesulfobacillus acetoxydans]CAA7602531.1 Glycoside hydrolase/deacetylase, beta/alpha-barrel [Acididesulfobacillus acetoxydans]CEJ06518.1 Polysaccharide deacetylase [Acididesulfobacillus acetoxydans]
MIFWRISRRGLAVAAVVALLCLGWLADRVVVAPANVPEPLEQVRTEAKVIALTFNVDWGEEYLPQILAELGNAGARATFFVTGRWAKNHPELVRKIAEAGQEVENHGYSHPHPDRLSVGANEEEIKKTESIIQGLIGYRTRYYAPPYGERGSSGLKAAQALGYRTVLWTLDTVDWRSGSTPGVIAGRILAPPVRFGIKPDQRGAIVLMHPKENTLRALPDILKALSQQGFRFLTIDQLITFEKEGNTTS